MIWSGFQACPIQPQGPSRFIFLGPYFVKFSFIFLVQVFFSMEFNIWASQLTICCQKKKKSQLQMSSGCQDSIAIEGCSHLCSRKESIESVVLKLHNLSFYPGVLFLYVIPYSYNKFFLIGLQVFWLCIFKFITERGKEKNQPCKNCLRKGGIFIILSLTHSQ